MKATDKTYLSAREAAQYIGYSVRYVYTLAALGVLPHYTLAALGVLPHYTPNGGRIIFSRVELDEWIRSNGKRQGKPEDDCLVIR